MQLLTVLLSIVTIWVTHALFSRWQRHDKERRLGCKPPIKYPHRLPWLLDPWGRDLKKQRLQGFATGRYNRLFQEQFLRCGHTFEERSPIGSLICTTDDDNWRTILSLKSEDYWKQEVKSWAFRRGFGDGIFTNDGSAWRHSRDMIKPLFVRAELNDVDRFKRHVDRLFAVLPRNGRTIDMMPWMSKLFLDSGSEFIFGNCFNSLSGKSAEGDEIMSLFKACRSQLGKGRVLGGRLPFFSNKEYEETCDKIHAYVDRQVARALAEASDDKPPGRYILIDELAKEEKDPVKLRFEVIQIFMPAAESVSNMFSNILFYLARHPHIWADLRHEALALKDEPQTFELLKSLHNFRNVILETIRIHGSSGRLSRTALRDTVIPRGGGPDGESPILVPKGTRVMLEMYSKLHDPRVWGGDAEIFRPSRFEGRRLRWDFNAFSGGPRICPAQQQVFTQLTYLLVRLTREFERLENRDPCLEYVEAINVSAQSRNGVQVALHEGNDV